MMQPDSSANSSQTASPVVSAHAFAQIGQSPSLSRRLAPDGLLHSPYEVLDYAATLTLHDPGGIHATFTRRQSVRFLQDGVSAILDHAWGDGVLLTDYETDAGVLERSIADEGRRHIVLGLHRTMQRNDLLNFRIRRASMITFTGEREWIETVIDHPVRQLSQAVVFPADRPCGAALLEAGGGYARLPIWQLRDRRTLVCVDVGRPQAHTSYTVRWSW